MRTFELIRNHLRSEVEVPVQLEKIGSSYMEFIFPDTFCSVAAGITSTETVWPIKNTNLFSATGDVCNNYGVWVKAS